MGYTDRNTDLPAIIGEEPKIEQKPATKLVNGNINDVMTFLKTKESQSFIQNGRVVFKYAENYAGAANLLNDKLGSGFFCSNRDGGLKISVLTQFLNLDLNKVSPEVKFFIEKALTEIPKAALVQAGVSNVEINGIKR